MVVQVEIDDALKQIENKKLKKDDPLLLMRFQQMVEQKAFVEGGGKFVALPNVWLIFVRIKYLHHFPGVPICRGYGQQAWKMFCPGLFLRACKAHLKDLAKKLKGYYTNEAIVVATESRTSSTVRIPRDAETLAHPQLINFYPCGEGAGYAGGIVSAAMDGEKTALKIAAALVSE